MMRILFEVGSTCIGGAERVVLRLAKGLRKLRPDWVIDCVVLCDHGGLEQEYLETFHHLWNGPKHYKDSGWKIIELVNEHGYQIVHAIDSFQLVAAAAELCRTTHFVQNVFPNIKTSPFAPQAGWADQAIHLSAIITEFRGNLVGMPTPGRAPGILDVIPNGIDTEFWTPDPKQGHYVDVVWCARTDPEKGIERAMELVPLLDEREIGFCIVTSEIDGPQDRLRKLTQEFSFHFTFNHALSPERLRSLFRKTKVFLSTSKVEGMPATPLEAAACGCSLMLPAIDGLAEVFGGVRRSTGLDDAFLYDPAWSARDLAEMLASDVALILPEDGVLARSVAERYSVDKMVWGYLGIYDRLLETEL